MQSFFFSVFFVFLTLSTQVHAEELSCKELFAQASLDSDLKALSHSRLKLLNKECDIEDSFAYRAFATRFEFRKRILAIQESVEALSEDNIQKQARSEYSKVTALKKEIETNPLLSKFDRKNYLKEIESLTIQFMRLDEELSFQDPSLLWVKGFVTGLLVAAATGYLYLHIQTFFLPVASGVIFKTHRLKPGHLGPNIITLSPLT